MMICKEAIEHLHEFLDNELDVGNYSEIKQHIDMCHNCCEKFEFEQALKKIIKDKTPHYKTPQHLLQSIASRWAEMDEEYNRGGLAAYDHYRPCRLSFLFQAGRVTSHCKGGSRTSR